jgi:hypothetical protein
VWHGTGRHRGTQECLLAAGCLVAARDGDGVSAADRR